jgi:hypothetical protein
MLAHSTYAAASLPILLTEYFRPSQEEVEEDAFMAEQARWLRKMRDGGSDDAEQ